MTDREYHDLFNPSDPKLSIVEEFKYHHFCYGDDYEFWVIPQEKFAQLEASHLAALEAHGKAERKIGRGEGFAKFAETMIHGTAGLLADRVEEADALIAVGYKKGRDEYVETFGKDYIQEAHAAGSTEGVEKCIEAVRLLRFYKLPDDFCRKELNVIILAEEALEALKVQIIKP